MVDAAHIITDMYAMPVDQAIFLVFLVFTRVGGFLMVVPAFGSARIPVNIKIFFSVAFSMVLVPIVKQYYQPLLEQSGLDIVVKLLISELFLGILMGSTIHLFFYALQFSINIISTCIGYNALGAHGLLENQNESVWGNFFALLAVMIFFATNMHLIALKAVITSYNTMRPGFMFDSKVALADIVDALVSSFGVLFRISSPFIVYSILVHFSVGIINKLTPLIPAYFISTIAIMLGGALLLYFLMPHIGIYFSSELTNWIANKIG